MKAKTLLALAVALTFAATADAGPLRRRAVQQYQPASVPYTTPAALSPVSTAGPAEAVDALAEVNAARAARGLRPYIRDAGLTVAARGAAEYRAARGIAGHSANDFAFLPPNSTATAAGCGALDPSWNWRSCCTYDGYTYAGAAIVERGGVRYMHIFCR